MQRLILFVFPLCLFHAEVTRLEAELDRAIAEADAASAKAAAAAAAAAENATGGMSEEDLGRHAGMVEIMRARACDSSKNKG